MSTPDTPQDPADRDDPVGEEIRDETADGSVLSDPDLALDEPASDDPR